MIFRKNIEKKPDLRVWDEIRKRKIELDKKGMLNPRPRTEIENIMLRLYKMAGEGNFLNR